MLRVKFEKSEDLLKVLKSAENILNENKAETKLKYIKLSNLDNKLQIMARNPHLRLEYIVENIEEIEGDAALYDYKLLSSLLNVCKDSIEINDGSIKSKKCSYKIPCIDADDYPEDVIPVITNYINVNGKEFKEAIENVSYATEKEITGVMNGIYVGDNKLIGCDSKRIFMQNIKLGENIKDTVLPKELVKELVKLPFEESIFITKFGGNIIIKDEKLTIVSSILADKYPNVEAVIPKQIKNTITLNKDDLLNALTMIMPVIDDTTKKCYLEYDNETMKISADNNSKSAKTSISIKSNVKESVKIKFNIQYLFEAIKTHKEKITINTYNDGIGYMFESENKRQFVMPMIN